MLSLLYIQRHAIQFLDYNKIAEIAKEINGYSRFVHSIKLPVHGELEPELNLMMKLADMLSAA